jgi:hypothetical protein
MGDPANTRLIKESCSGRLAWFENLRRVGFGPDFAETGKLKLWLSKMAQAEHLRANQGRICVDFRLEKESSACCGVNLAFAGFGVGWRG